MKRSLFLAIIVIAQLAQAKVLVITHACNRPEFIPIQHKTLKKFLLADYEFVVFNDARDPHLRKAISKTCKDLGITHIKIPQEIHDRPYLYRMPGESYNHACVRCANVVQYSLDTLAFNHDDLVLVIDSDLFLVKPFDIREYMRDYDLAGLAQSRDPDVYYIWNGIFILNVPALPHIQELNFNCGIVKNSFVDVGGYTHYYLEKYASTLRIKYMGATRLSHLLTDCSEAELHAQGFNAQTIQFIKKGIHNTEFFENGTFFHYRGGTNWDGQSQQYHLTKKSILDECLAEILN